MEGYPAPPSPEDIREELAAVYVAIKEQKASWPYAYAMAGGCHGGSEHPALRAVVDEVDRLIERKENLEAQLAEFEI